MDLAAAKNDLAVAQKQLDLLKNSPTPEDLRQEEAKVAQADAALATANVQRQMMTITAPIDATVVAVSVNPGESVDPTKTLVQLVAMDRLMVDVDVPADQLPAKAEGLVGADHFCRDCRTADAGEPLDGQGVVRQPAGGSEERRGDGGHRSAGRCDAAAGADGARADHRRGAQGCAGRPARSGGRPTRTATASSPLVEGEQATHKTVKAGLEENGLIEITADG